MAKGRPNKGTGTTGPKKPGNSKELSWSEKDFDEATLNKVRKYRSKKGL